MIDFAYPGDADSWLSRHAQGPCTVLVASYSGLRYWLTRVLWPFSWDRDHWEDEYFAWEREYRAALDLEADEPL